MNLLHDLLDRSAANFPDKEALVDGKQRLTYRQFADASRTCAALLTEHGLEPGDRVAVDLEKSCEEAFAIFAASMAGGVVVPINPLLRPRQVAHILGDCGVRFLITTARRFGETGDAALGGGGSLHRVLLIDGGNSPNDARLVPLAFAPARSPGGAAARHGGDLAAILYTSGSTGMPKGVMLSHDNLLAGSRIVCRYLGIRRDERILSVLPFSFDYGLNQLLTAVERGATTILIRFRFGNEIVRAIADERVTGLAGVPGLWSVLADATPQFHKQVLPSLRYMTNSGGRMPLEALRRIRAAQPQADFVLMYGFTEAFRSTYLPAAEIDERPTSIGKAIPETEVLVVNDHGETCCAGEEGILVHDGPTVFLGYWDRPEETREILRPHPLRPREGGRLVCYSGDRVKMDDDGYLYFVGRDDAMIKSSGYRISPTEVEGVLLEAASVREAAVIGIADAILEQSIKAFVALREGASFDSDDLLAFCAERLPRYMVPSVVKVVDGVPKNPNGKIDYPLLRQRDEGTAR